MKNPQGAEVRYPQDTDILKRLRSEQQKLSQTKMAEVLTQAFYEATGIRHVIQQPDICRLENGTAAIDIFKLLAYSDYCNVDIRTLLNQDYKGLLRNVGSDMHAKTFHKNADVEQHLLKLEKKQRLLISAQFPSSFFRLDKDSARYAQLNALDYEAKELYSISSFINFLFSPVGQYSLDQKKAILDAYLSYFQDNNFRQLHFFPISALPDQRQLSCMELLPEQNMLLLPGPITHEGEGDSFIEVRDQAIYQAATRFCRSLRTFENSMVYLRIGMAALDNMRDGSPAREAITSFALEILRMRDINAFEAIKCFSPEIQNMINQ